MNILLVEDDLEIGNGARIAVLTRLRRERQRTPVPILTARDASPVLMSLASRGLRVRPLPMSLPPRPSCGPSTARRTSTTSPSP